jgi:hypothetical protein
MQILDVSPSNSTSKLPRKSRTKPEPTEAQLREQVRTARRTLDAFVKKQREATIARLGELAYKAGLANVADDVLSTEFATLAKRLLGMAVLVLASLTGTGCMTTGTPIDVTTLQRQMAQSPHPACTSLVDTLGTPTNVTTRSDGTSTMVYQHRNRQLDPKGLIPVAGVFLAKDQTTVQTVTFECDGRGNLSTYTTTTEQTQ